MTVPALISGNYDHFAVLGFAGIGFCPSIKNVKALTPSLHLQVVVSQSLLQFSRHLKKNRRRNLGEHILKIQCQTT
jgi:hypothetical protein